MKPKICSIICVICLLFSSSFVLSSCNSNDAIGITNAEINENGELILKYSDGTEQNLGVVVGSDGVDGENGLNGADGKDGEMQMEPTARSTSLQTIALSPPQAQKDSEARSVL